MRPARLELQGFTAFREPVTVDFSDAELFALVGPTGSGKSSLIDALCFALYGTVPRLDRRAVAPVVSTGRQEARIRLDFTVGEQAYAAVRVVRRTKTGATTKEARLERGEETLAGDADGVTRAVEDLLGLGFEQFTRCIVLPQGEFARFLHDPPRDRQELLVRLLELGVYERMRQAAGMRAVDAEGRAELLARQLEDLGEATPERLAETRLRVAAFTDLRHQIEEAQPELDACEEARRAAAQEEQAATAAAARLEALQVPPGVEALTEAAGQAADAARTAARAADAAEQAVRAAEEARVGLGDAEHLRRARDDHAERAALEERIAKGELVVAEAVQAEDQAEQARTEAEKAARAATAALEALRREHAAHVLAAELTVGAPCPVCQQVVVDLPERTPPGALEAAEARATEAERAYLAAAERHDEAKQRRASLEGHLRSLREQHAAVESRLAGVPPVAEVEQRLAAIAEADVAVEQARARERTARELSRERQRVADEARVQRDAAWGTFHAARDNVSALGPPPVDAADLAGSWTALVTWAGEEAARQRRLSAAAAERVRAASARHTAITDGLAERCAAAGVELGGRAPRDAVTDALARAEADERRMAEDVARAERLRAEQAELVERAAVARALAQHLAANRFERWLLDEALQRLAAGASVVLRELSGGQYSLAVDAQRNFEVIDHRSADERRPARTLSGGETFLASLALALTLADHLMELAAATTPRLESIFLDEGFGTLDPETLDVVAAAVEELGARGRTVGLVTHVRDLADRVPVRYEVRKGPAGSTVERVAG